MLLLFMTLLRVVFYLRFRAPEADFVEYLHPFLTGLNFDLRIVCGIVLFPFLLGSVSIEKSPGGRWRWPSILRFGFTVLLFAALVFFMKKGHASTGTLIFFALLFLLVLFWLLRSGNGNPFENWISERIITAWYIFAIVLLVLFYAFDLEHYDYLQQRLSASVINFAGDAKISFDMILETYPVFKLLLFVIGSITAMIWLMRYTFKRIARLSYVSRKPFGFASGALFALLLGLGIFGRIDQYPLRWSDAFVFRDDFKANLALNPVQSFLSTMQFRNSGYDLQIVKEYYPLMSRYLHVAEPDNQTLNFKRSFTPQPGTPKRNVIIVIAESFSMYKSTMAGNKLNTTPFFNSLCEDGLFFDRCFTPAHGTARGIWATITGIPDVEYPNTSSRNPEYVDQHSIINDYEGYEKYYFIGGSSSWANIRGLLTNNLSGLKLREEQDFNVNRTDVWGISDKRLFLAANDTLASLDKPFIAVIQTADNHRPYTIPEEDKGEFSLVSYSKDTLFQYGFSSNEELNAFRYSDFAFQKFIEAARKEAYFDNTIFVFVGDHGVKGDMGTIYPRSWTAAGLSLHHVPLLFYAPDFLPARSFHRVSSQSDIMPSVSALAGISYTNTTMGINLFDTTSTVPPVAFIYDPTVRTIGVVTNRFVFNHNLLSDKREIWSLNEIDIADAQEEKEMRNLMEAWYQTARYLLSHNQKRNVRSAGK